MEKLNVKQTTRGGRDGKEGKMKYLTAILKTVGPSLIIPFTVLCTFPVLVFFAISRTKVIFNPQKF
jgi:hypothetical protein